MSLVTTRALECDTCHRIEDFGLIQPVTADVLRAAAYKAGWFHSRQRSIDGTWSVPDTCSSCARPQTPVSVGGSSKPRESSL